MQSSTDAELAVYGGQCGVPGAAPLSPMDHEMSLSFEPSIQDNTGSHNLSLNDRSMSQLTINRRLGLAHVGALPQDLFSDDTDDKLKDDFIHLEQLELDEWKRQHGPNTALDIDQLRREVDNEVKLGNSQARSVQTMLRNLSRCREKMMRRLERVQEVFQLPFLAQQEEPVDSKIVCDASQSWALVIGIDAYEHLNPLNGCVNDANLMYEFLTEHLGIPNSHINVLTTDNDSRRPTRENIVNAFYDLRDNNNIRVGDDIIIYFSGHGTRYDASMSRALRRKKKGWFGALCPVDHSDQVPDISDVQLTILVQEIASMKGSHIVVILDSCYSGGMARACGSADAYLAVQSINPVASREGQDLDRMLRAVDNHPCRNYSGPILFTLWQKDKMPGILMAACRSSERAWERQLGPSNKYHGVFTYMLVAALKLGTKGLPMTYEDVKMKLRVLLSHPRAPTGLQHTYLTGDGRDHEVWYQLRAWLRGSVSWMIMSLLFKELRSSLCTEHDEELRPSFCVKCQATARAFEALYAHVQFSAITYSGLNAILTEMDRILKRHKIAKPVVKESTMPDLNAPDSNKLHRFKSVQISMTWVQNFTFMTSDLDRLIKMMDVAAREIEKNVVMSAAEA